MIEIEKQLKKLRLSGIAETINERNREAIKAKLSYLDFLKIILQDEELQRSNKKFGSRMRSAKFKSEKGVEDFDFKFNPKINEPQIKDLALCNFIKECAPIHIVGPSGTGKSHIAQAIGRVAIMKGHEVLFISQTNLLKELQHAKATDSVSKLKKRLSSVTVLIIDDFGIKPLTECLEELLHEVIDDRYERLPIIITSNLHFDEWSDAFKNKLLAAAVIDRLKGNAHEVVLIGKSYRQIKKTAIK
jgi:DNA replication protein DnaC